MFFADFNELLEMGGHGLYVWSGYGLTLVCVLGLLLLPIFRHRRLRREFCQQFEVE